MSCLDEIENLKNQDAAVKDEIENLKNQDAAVKDEIENLKNQVAAAKDEIENLKNQDAAVKDEIENLKNQDAAVKDEIENLKNQVAAVAAAIGKFGFLLQCGQQAPITFSEAFPNEVLSSGRKIGEGVFGEVFMLERPGEGRSVIKIIPIEGAQMVNGSVQKRYDEVLSELIITDFSSKGEYCPWRFVITGDLHNDVTIED
ncbi:uncharacterized protein LOC128989382 [Macrosteles quadrilineatus]|uniref:uncharacterized protein LOC128989382 n=1 Tax=Macrosteles quadrilineatus TaxID=74068 RepID=UPI0023E3478F|nr:uncharacterized protein LOC128989382 [Macrosteles quadrilineatus]